MTKQEAPSTFWGFAGEIVLRMVAQGRTRLLVTLAAIAALTYAMHVDGEHTLWYAIGVTLSAMAFIVSKSIEGER